MARILYLKLLLAVISASSYWLLQLVSEKSAALDEILSKRNTGLYLIGLVFGALVMAPYVAAANRRILRGATMCVASAAIYFAAVRFVVDGPFSYDTIIPYLIAGGAAALLVGLTIVAVTLRPLPWVLIPLTIAAGAAGGAVFNGSFGGALEVGAIAGHFAWQVLVCLALHFSFRETPT